MGNPNPVENEIREILVSQLRIKPEAVSQIESETPLLGRGVGLDSMEALTLITALENRFKIEVRDEELSPRLFRSLGELSAFVAEKLVTSSEKE